MPAKREMPSTVQRSPRKAQETWVKTHDNAVDEYGEGERAHRTAFASLKHSFQKVGDHWEPKGHKGPSDPQAEQTGAAARRSTAKSYGGVDVNGQTKAELVEQARAAGVRGYSSMNKSDLGDAINRANQQATRKAR